MGRPHRLYGVLNLLHGILNLRSRWKILEILIMSNLRDTGLSNFLMAQSSCVRLLFF